MTAINKLLTFLNFIIKKFYLIFMAGFEININQWYEELLSIKN